MIVVIGSCYGSLVGLCVCVMRKKGTSALLFISLVFASSSEIQLYSAAAECTHLARSCMTSGTNDAESDAKQRGRGEAVAESTQI